MSVVKKQKTEKRSGTFGRLRKVGNRVDIPIYLNNLSFQEDCVSSDGRSLNGVRMLLRKCVISTAVPSAAFAPDSLFAPIRCLRRCAMFGDTQSDFVRNLAS